MKHGVVITVTSFKGGTGKTTISTNLAHTLSWGKFIDPSKPIPTVLIVDVNPQGNVAQNLGMDRGDGAYNYMHQMEDVEDEAFSTGRDRLAILTGSRRIETAERYLTLDMGLGRTTLQDVADRFRALTSYADIVVIDTGDTGTYQEAAIMAADKIVSPIVPEFLSVQGLADLTERIHKLRNEEVSPKNLLVVPNMIGHVGLHRHIIMRVNEMYPGMVAKGISRRTAIAHSSAAGQTVHEFKYTGIMKSRGEFINTAYQIGVGHTSFMEALPQGENEQ